MHKINLFARKMIYFILLTSINFSWGWTVKVINFTDENITVDIHSSQIYPYLEKGIPVKRTCEFVGQQIDAHLTRDFNYEKVNFICIAPCTKSVNITSPVKLSSQNKLTSCSNVNVIVRKDESGQWKIEYHDWTAGIRKMLEERTRMPAAVRDIYDKFGASPIQEITVFREPIVAGIRELMTTLTKDTLKKLNYDELYHTGLIIKCRDQFIRLERQETVSSAIQKKDPRSNQGLETRNIILPQRTINYSEFINKAMENDPNFWKYHPVTNNCQLFVLQCLEKNNLEVSPDLFNFIYQDAEQVLANNPVLKNVSIATTSLANRIGKVVEGISDVTVQNGTPYTIRVKTHYAGENKLLKICLPDDFLLESGKEKTVSHGVCLLTGIKVAASLKGIGTIKDISHKQLEQAADIFSEKSFKGESSASLLIQLVEGRKFTIENMSLSSAELQKLAAEAQANSK